MSSIALELDPLFRRATMSVAEAESLEELNYLRERVADLQNQLSDSRSRFCDSLERIISFRAESASLYRQMASKFLAAAELVDVMNVELDSEGDRVVRPLVEEVQDALLRHAYRPSKVPSRDLSKRFDQATQEENEAKLELLQNIVILWPEALAMVSEKLRARVLAIHIPWWAYLRSMWNLFWSAIRHPLSETTIDLSTGRVLYRT